MRIISLVPSWSEYIVDLGLGAQLVGRTKFCVRTPGFERTAAVIGGTKNIHVDKIERLKPDVIIACKEENTRAQVEQCAQFADIVLTDVRSVQAALGAMQDIASALRASERGLERCERIEAAWGPARDANIRAAYVIWKQPLMVAGKDTYIHDVMRWWGIENACAAVDSVRYPTLEEGALDLMELDAVLLSSEPYPFKEQDLAAYASPGRQAVCVDGEAFSWYGSRMLHVAAYLEQISDELRTATD